MKLIDLLVQELPKRGGWPESAVTAWQSTHDGEVYFSGADGEFTEENNGGTKNYFPVSSTRGTEYIITREQYEAALAAAQPQWDGEGLPPVGCVCEYETKFNGWQPVRIELIKSEGIAFTWLANSESYNGLDCVGVQKAASFRPIRSEADEKREKFIQAVIDFDKRIFGSTTTRFGALYDAIAAGKIPGIRIE